LCRRETVNDAIDALLEIFEHLPHAEADAREIKVLIILSDKTLRIFDRQPSWYAMLNSGPEAGKKASGGQCGDMSGCFPIHHLLALFARYHDSEGRYDPSPAVNMTF
jgi:hypothetical protein